MAEPTYTVKALDQSSGWGWRSPTRPRRFRVVAGLPTKTDHTTRRQTRRTALPRRDCPVTGLAAMMNRQPATNPEGKAAMTAETKFTIGVRASCSDGHCGEVRRLIIDPATDAVTHLVIQPGHQKEAARLVPSDLVETTEGGIRLRCTRAEFDRLDHAEERELADQADQYVGAGGLLGSALVYGDGGEAYAPMGPGERVDLGPMPMPRHPRTMVEDVVPLGEEQVRPGDKVHAVDGEIGRVRGFLVNPGDDRVTHVLLEEGHLWGRKEVAIPVTAVTRVDQGIRLNLTKEQVGDLPPAD
jgi:hypothetical protein